MRLLIHPLTDIYYSVETRIRKVPPLICLSKEIYFVSRLLSKNIAIQKIFGTFTQMIFQSLILVSINYSKSWKNHFLKQKLQVH